jgi:hypothetical protein
MIHIMDPGNHLPNSPLHGTGRLFSAQQLHTTALLLLNPRHGWQCDIPTTTRDAKPPLYHASSLTKLGLQLCPHRLAHILVLQLWRIVLPRWAQSHLRMTRHVKQIVPAHVSELNSGGHIVMAWARPRIVKHHLPCNLSFRAPTPCT